VGSKKTSPESNANSEAKNSETKNSELVKVKDSLQKSVNKWLKSNASYVLDCNSPQDDIVCVIVYLNDSNEFAAKIRCPFRDCRHTISLLRKKLSWNTNNFYRHFERTHLSPNTSQQVPGLVLKGSLDQNQQVSYM